MLPEYIVELNEHNFRPVLEQSVHSPVVIHFWAPMSQESAEIIPQLQTLAQQYKGAFTLALLNCEQEQMIAGQFGVQALPTIAVFVNGQPVDGLGGPQSIEAITQMLNKHLPSQAEMTLKEIEDKLNEKAYSEALTLISSLPQDELDKGDVKLAWSEALIGTQQFEQAKTLLDNIPLEYQDNHYKSLIAKLKLHEQASNSPEIQLLESRLAEDPTSISIAHELALQYHQVNRSEEALEILWSYLAKDLNCLDGEVKKSFMDILSALGQGNESASKYRRQLYSLLY